MSGSAALAADHLDAPGLTPPGGDTSLDLADVYAFPSPATPGNVVLIMTLNPLAGVLNDGTFNPKASYDFFVDTNADAKQDLRYSLTFSEADTAGGQDVLLRRIGARKPAVVARGRTGNTIGFENGGKLRADVFDDPFFFDLCAFLSLSPKGAPLALCGAKPGGFCSPGVDFFAGLNVSAIVLELPAGELPDQFGLWARTEVGVQVDRTAIPVVNSVFIPQTPLEPNDPSLKDAFNSGMPKHDPRDFRPEIVDNLEVFYGVGSPLPQVVADLLLPDILPVDQTAAPGFNQVPFNGRQLEDDVIDFELTVLTGGLAGPAAIPSDCVDANDVPFSPVFPYLAPAH